MSQPSLAAPARAERRDDRNFGLDLARFLAMALVLVQHASSMFMGIVGLQPAFVVLMFSFYGVELFFVLSGFLIGRLLFRIAETDATPRGWLVFMVRRWLRTLPLYYVWLVVVLLLVPPGTDPMGHLLRYAAMAQNIAWPMPADHWYNESWSLVSEEWFYLLFAAALIGAVALTRNTKAIWPVIGAFIVVPLLARILHPAPANFQDQIYHVALYRLDAIAYGVALAKLHQQNSRLFRYPWLAFGICAVLVTVHLVGLGVPINSVWFGIVFRQVFGLLWGISIALCLFLVAVLPLRSFLGPFTWFIRTGARLSYGIYLMHLTIIATVAGFAAPRGLGLGFVIPVSLTLIAVLPYLSYRFFETPIMSLRPRQSHPAAVDAPARVSARSERTALASDLPPPLAQPRPDTP